MQTTNGLHAQTTALRSEVKKCSHMPSEIMQHVTQITEMGFSNDSLIHLSTEYVFRKGRIMSAWFRIRQQAQDGSARSPDGQSV